MIVNPRELPSRGLDSNSESLNIKPLNFQEMIEYTRNYDASRSELDKYICDVELVKKRIHNWKSINLMDLDYVIFLIKKESVSQEAEFSVRKTCNECGEENTLYLDPGRLVMPTTTKYELRGTVQLKGREVKFQLPSLEVFDKVLTKIARFKKVKELRLIKLIAMFPDFADRPNDIEDMVVTATNEDIVVLRTLESLYLNSSVSIEYKCTKCKGGSWSIGVHTLIDDIFLSLVLSTKSIESKISIKQVCED
jgi:hypothetical protein